MTTTAIRPEWVAVPGEAGPAAVAGRTVVIEGDRIAEVSDHPIAGDRVIEAPGCVLIPGLVNGHTHIGVSPIGRGVVEDADFSGRPFYMAVSAVTGIAYEPEFRDELHALFAAELAGLIRGGVTCIINQNAVEAGHLLGLLDTSGLRAYSGPILPASPLARGTLDAGGRIVREAVPADMLRGEIDAAIGLHQQYDQGLAGRIRVIVGPASAEICPDEFLLEMAELNRKWGVPLTLHLAQSEHDVRQAHQMFGKTSTGHLADLGLVGPNLIAAHGSLLSEDDVNILREGGATIAHCASRKAKEGVFSPFQSYLDRGLRVILANDGFTTDFLEEIRQAAMFGKLAIGSTSRPNAASTLAAATSAAGEALGRTDIGRIEPGAKADLVLVSLSSPFVAPVLDPLVSLVYYASGQDVRSAWVDGRQVLDDGHLTTMDLDATMRRGAEAAATIWRVARERGRIQ